MASYGVSPDEEGLLPWDWAAERLTASRNYWLTTVDGSGRPHSMPVWGVWAPNDRFWFASAPDSLKMRNIASNPNVVVAADDTVEVVSVEGIARSIESRRDIAEQFGIKYGEDDTETARLADFFFGSHMCEVTPVRAFGLIEREEDFARSATRWVF